MARIGIKAADEGPDLGAPRGTEAQAYEHEAVRLLPGRWPRRPGRPPPFGLGFAELLEQIVAPEREFVNQVHPHARGEREITTRLADIRIDEGQCQINPPACHV